MTLIGRPRRQLNLWKAKLVKLNGLITLAEPPRPGRDPKGFVADAAFRLRNMGGADQLVCFTKSVSPKKFPFLNARFGEALAIPLTDEKSAIAHLNAIVEALSDPSNNDDYLFSPLMCRGTVTVEGEDGEQTLTVTCDGFGVASRNDYPQGVYVQIAAPGSRQSRISAWRRNARNAILFAVSYDGGGQYEVINSPGQLIPTLSVVPTIAPMENVITLDEDEESSPAVPRVFTLDSIEDKEVYYDEF